MLEASGNCPVAGKAGHGLAGQDEISLIARLAVS